MISEPGDGLPTEAYVWIWLPEAREPVVAGRVSAQGEQLVFNYGRRYLARDNAIALFGDLPLVPGIHRPGPGRFEHGVLRDGAPDAWGRRVLDYRQFGSRGAARGGAGLSELGYMLGSGSDRIGALDFQTSATRYVARDGAATLDEMWEAAELIQAGLPITRELADALQHGTSVGGARPKAQLRSDDGAFIAKFSAPGDQHKVVANEFVTMRLARLAGLTVADVALHDVHGKQVLLVRRFDRDLVEGLWHRRMMVSGLTIMGEDEQGARYLSYTDLAEQVRRVFVDPARTLRELYGRMVFNVLCSNTDDHARNHAAFWDGTRAELTPAYDITPTIRTGGESSQSLAILDGERISRVSTCVKAAGHFRLSRDEAVALINRVSASIVRNFAGVAGEAGLTPADEDVLRRNMLHPSVFHGRPEGVVEVTLAK